MATGTRHSGTGAPGLLLSSSMRENEARSQPAVIADGFLSGETSKSAR
jgi:hypothetical protein